MTRDFDWRNFGVNRFIPLLATLALHLWLLALLWQHRTAPDIVTSETRMVLVLLQPEPMPRPAKQAALDTPRRSVKPKSTPQNESSAITLPSPPKTEATEPPPEIDWKGAAELSAKNLAAQLNSEPQQRALDSGATRDRSVNKKKKSEFEWRPETKRYGLTPQGLPYFQLSRHCVYITFVVACAIGKLPPPNKDLFEHMDDPNEMEGSVPE